MDKNEGLKLDRRELLRATCGMVAGAAWASEAWADDLPAITRPRATSGDTAVEPDWEQRLTITVGPKDADLVGAGHKPIQAAVDYVAGLGGGTVHRCRSLLGVLAPGPGVAQIGHRPPDGLTDGRGERRVLGQRLQGPGRPVGSRPVHGRTRQRRDHGQGGQDDRRHQRRPAPPACGPCQRHGTRIKTLGGLASVREEPPVQPRKRFQESFCRPKTKRLLEPFSLEHLQGGGETVVEARGPVGCTGCPAQTRPGNEPDDQRGHKAARHEGQRRRRMGQGRRQDPGHGDPQARDDQGRRRCHDRARQARLHGADGKQASADAGQTGDERVHEGLAGLEAVSEPASATAGCRAPGRRSRPETSST